MKQKLNFIFWGTPDVASETLEILKKNGYLPSLIITASDKPQGRKMLLTPPPVKVWAEENRIPYMQPEKLTPSAFGTSPLLRGRLGRGLPDLFIVVAYGKIMPKEILEIPKLGSINIHYSLLPKYRGASPVESAILNGDTETGITIQQMELKMDAGPILAQEKVIISPIEKASELRARLIKIGGKLLVTTLPKILEAEIQPIRQNEENATYCQKIKKEDGLIDLNADPIKNFNKFRAYTTWPRTYFFKNGKRIIITEARLEDDKFTIKKVVQEGKKEVGYK